MNEYPFPDKKNSLSIFYSDYVFPKIDKEKVEAIFEDAWNTGEEQARLFLQRYGGDEPLQMLKILEKNGVRIVRRDIDNVLGRQRYFCEFFSKKKELFIYTESVHLWCESNHVSYEKGLNLILCHEYFHYLEQIETGMISRRYQVPILKLGPIKVGKTGIPSLSEIAANAFAGVCWMYMEEKEDGVYKDD